MLNDSHLKVKFYEQDSSKVFANTDIKGGVAITYHSLSKEYGAIGTFTPYEELNSIIHKVAPLNEAESITSIIYVQNRFNLDNLYMDYPDFRDNIGSNGRDKRFRNNIFEKIPLFIESKKSSEDICVIGVVNNKRQWRCFPRKYTDLSHENLDKWKVLVVRVNGRGTLGEVLSTPIIAEPGKGYTQTFIGIGAFENKEEAENALKYIKSKFARTMLGVLKITQDNNKDTWSKVPSQDFTANSDIDWTAVDNIDKQLYKKYGLSEKEIEFIEEKAKEMA